MNFAYDPTAGANGLGQAVWTVNGGAYNNYQIAGTWTLARIHGAVFDSFGILCGWRTTAANPDPWAVYFDDVCYTVGAPVRISNVSLGGGNVTLTFTSAAATNKVQVTSSLAPTSWSDVAGVTFTGPSLTNLTSTAQFAQPVEASRILPDMHPIRDRSRNG